MRVRFRKTVVAWVGFFCAALLSSCVFDTQVELDIPRTDFDLSLLQSAKNPVTAWYPMDNAKSVVGLKFAFQTMNYAREVDSNVEAFRDEAGEYPALVGAYFDLASQPKNLKTFLDAVHAKGGVPYVTLDPKIWQTREQVAYQKTLIGRVSHGEFDAQLRGLAEVLKNFSHLVLLRFAHEMNGEWYPYSGGGDADGDGVPDGPDKYIQAWHHVHDLFAEVGATQLLWVFCPGAEDFPVANWNRPFQYYPGSEYADLIFVDAYEHANKRAQNLGSTLEYFYNELGLFLQERRAAGDSSLPPFGLGEFGTNQVKSDAKAVWYAESLGEIADDSRIKFHILYNGRNKDEDFSIAGLGARMKQAYAELRFQFRLF
jgi:hypothetical protein